MFQMNENHEQQYAWYKKQEVVHSDPLFLVELFLTEQPVSMKEQ